MRLNRIFKIRRERQNIRRRLRGQLEGELRAAAAACRRPDTLLTRLVKDSIGKGGKTTAEWKGM